MTFKLQCVSFLKVDIRWQSLKDSIHSATLKKNPWVKQNADLRAMRLFNKVLCFSCLTLSLSLLFYAFSFLHLLFVLVWFSSSLRAHLSSPCQCPNVLFSFPPLCEHSQTAYVRAFDFLTLSLWLHPTLFLPSENWLSLFASETNTFPKAKYLFIYLLSLCVSVSWYRCVVVLRLMPVFGVIAIRA